MWIVRLALRRPYTFVVMAILIVILCCVTIWRMPTDIFPNIDIPVVSIVFNYDGMPPDQMESRIITNFERSLTTTVNNIEHIESQSLLGKSAVKVFFQPGTDVNGSVAQVTAIAQAAIRSMPPGITPPLILQYSASNVPILQLSLSSDKLSEQQLFDISNVYIRTPLAIVQGAQLPYPYGGKQRYVMVDIDPQKLYANKISPADVASAINQQNIVLPSGDMKIGQTEYTVRLNSSPDAVDELNDLPIKTIASPGGGNPMTIRIRDVGHVRDGFAVQNSMVHSDGKRGTLVSILKAGSASTLDIVSKVKEQLPKIIAGLPNDWSKTLKLTPMFDQSIFVRASIHGVIFEAVIAAVLTALMILVFLGSLRSMLIVVISIPLSIMVSIIVLSLLGETLNVMTLGGMALAVGILVDDATVEIENIHRNLHQGKRLVKAILDGASQIAVPAFVSTLCICIVFVPVIFISGAAKSLFIPLAMAVVFAMLTSYLLSRTLVPTMVHYLLASEVELYGGKPEEADKPRKPNYIVRAIDHFERSTLWPFHRWFNSKFDKLRDTYGRALAWSLKHRVGVLAAFVVFAGFSLCLIPLTGEDFFPQVDGGQIRLHVRCPPGTRLEQTEPIFSAVEDTIRQTIPASQLQTILDNFGIPNSSINLSLGDPSMISSADGEILVSLNPNHSSTFDYVDKLRKALNRRFPNETFFFLPADITTQVLNFGLSAPIDVQIRTPLQHFDQAVRLGRLMRQQVAAIPGAVDVHLQQVTEAPEIRVDVDRTLADQMGLTQQDVANSMLVSLSSSGQTGFSFWLDPKNLNQYTIAVQTPQYHMDSINELENTPISIAALKQPQLLGNLARITRATTPVNLTHYNVARTVDVLANVQGTDLGSVAKAVQKIIDEHQKDLPPGSEFTLRGQVQSMTDSFHDLGYGLIFAVLLVYMLMVVNFQSWLDPLIILMALPGALCGILWILFATRTNISVPSLMGAIMSIGVATSNSILMITFANDQRKEGKNARDAALAAGVTRLRPVIMTALAMIIGMLPMSLGLGEGGEQNAPLGRAVIGGLALATFATLFFVPVVYSALRNKPIETHVEKELQ